MVMDITILIGDTPSKGFFVHCHVSFRDFDIRHTTHRYNWYSLLNIHAYTHTPYTGGDYYWEGGHIIYNI